MIKKINIRFIILIAFLMPAVMTWAESTVDELRLSDVELSPGSDNEQKYATLSVVSAARTYAAFNVDVCLPEGVEPVLNNMGRPIVRKTGILPKDEDEYYHTLSATYYPDERKINIICYANPSVNFADMTGALCRIALTASTYAKPGKIRIGLTGQNLTTIDATKYEPEDAAYDITIGTTAKASLSVSSANKWSTCILPFATALPGGLKAYTCSRKDDEKGVFYLTNASSIEAYTPYILYNESESDYSGTLTGEVDASQYPEDGKVAQGYLTGAIKKQTTHEGYVLQNKGTGVKFYLMDSGQSYTIPAGKCWATPAASTAQSFSFEFPTAVNGIVEVAESKNESKYNLSGIMIDEPRSGQLYIQNGKKYVK